MYAYWYFYDKDHFVPEGSPWILLDSWHEVLSEGDVDAQAVFTFRIRRQSGGYIFSLLAPCLVKTLIALVAVAMPPDTPDRPMVSLTVLLALTFLNSEVMEKVPAKPHRVFLSSYTDISMVISSCCTAYYLIMCELSTKPYFKRKTIYNWSLARVCDTIAFMIGMICFLALNINGVFVAFHINKNENQ